ncbi:MAG: class I tRNA ligase family protein, partial [Acidobacteriota bacterium]|nr:class I tRNA ligase family protein [Acidobacteriota bacterium]
RNTDRVAQSQGAMTDADRIVLRKLHQTLKKVSDDFESRWHFNTSIASIMELVKVLYANESDLSGSVISEVMEKLVLMIEPFAPYLAEELWEELGRTGPVFKQQWPAYDPELARDAEADIVIQVNGKVRGRISVAFGTPNDTLEKRALSDSKVQTFVKDKQIVKIVVVPDKLVNIVVR